MSVACIFQKVNSRSCFGIAVLGAISLALFSLFFILLQDGKYRPDDIDDPWSLSFAYNYLHHGEMDDITTGSTRNQAGVRYFGKTYAFVLGKTMDFFGWNKTNGHLLSLLFLLMGLTLWIPLLRRLGFSVALSWAFPTSALLFEPFFSTAVCSRSEPFIFMLSTLAVWFFLQKRYFLSALAVSLAVETHPAGIIGIFYLSGVIAADPSVRSEMKSRLMKNLGWIGAGALVGAAYYVSLHLDSFRELPIFLSNQNSYENGKGGNFLYEYFFKTKLLRHLPELVLFSTGLFLLFRKEARRSNSFPVWLLFFSLLFALGVRHPNFHYAIFCYPAFLLVTLRAAEICGRLSAVLAIFLLLLIPQYAAIFYTNRNFDFPLLIKEVRGAVPEDALPVVGDMNDWYAFYDRGFYYNDYAIDETRLKLGKFYLIEDENYRRSNFKMKEWIEKKYKPVKVWTLFVDGRNFLVSAQVPLKTSKP